MPQSLPLHRGGGEPRNISIMSLLDHRKVFRSTGDFWSESNL
ncbi:hypothetical protein HMPREF9163_01082 [Selenomonas sp. oral taxon 138 str. F0429]|nr:hypothetical protein HMPREF9163_01082 [Selenomonas sp. oral taxon 138 str. F0429]